MDPNDVKILSLLQEDGRASHEEIARATGLQVDEVRDRIRNLEEQGVIKQYAAIVDAMKVGNEITAFMGVSVEHPRYNKAFLSLVMRLPEVQECHHVTGEDSYLLKIKAPSLQTIEHLTTDIFKALEGISRTRTFLALSTVKETVTVRVHPR